MSEDCGDLPRRLRPLTQRRGGGWFELVDSHIQRRCDRADDKIIKGKNKQATAPSSPRNRAIPLRERSFIPNVRPDPPRATSKCSTRGTFPVLASQHLGFRAQFFSDCREPCPQDSICFAGRGFAPKPLTPLKSVPSSPGANTPGLAAFAPPPHRTYGSCSPCSAASPSSSVN
jgi:hypothetical protein